MDDIAAAFGEQAALARRLLAALDSVRPGSVWPGSVGPGSVGPDSVGPDSVGPGSVGPGSIGPGSAGPGSLGDDGSHDLLHLLRVWRNAAAIAEREAGCDRTVLTAAVVLHDCVAVEKNSPLRAQASRLAAVRARDILGGMGWDAAPIDAAAHAIEVHSFSAGIAPETVEARVVQDADRLDAIGAIGIARCFYVAGRLGSPLYEPSDPEAVYRELDDRMFALDHFGAKLFKVAGNFQTAAGQALADERCRTMHDFVRSLLDEVGGGNG